jgi:hypothetical protein
VLHPSVLLALCLFLSTVFHRHSGLIIKSAAAPVCPLSGLYSQLQLQWPGQPQPLSLLVASPPAILLPRGPLLFPTSHSTFSTRTLILHHAMFTTRAAHHTLLRYQSQLSSDPVNTPRVRPPFHRATTDSQNGVSPGLKRATTETHRLYSLVSVFLKATPPTITPPYCILSTSLEFTIRY